ncbi:TetR family transcriptional regulator [Corynebacterium lubricantis]|uniref:TetR/AcrR family transcriptional regulator n=1 Tax=Corynebacterium lubricantis TaxID=541095 RepID=UPI003CCC2C5C
MQKPEFWVAPHHHHWWACLTPRAVAAEAGVSAGTIIHHFGSAEVLRRACDEHVLAEARARKSETLAPGPAGPAAFLSDLARVDDFAPLAGYILRRLQEGGELTSQLVDAFAEDALAYLSEGERDGTVSPSRAPEARARVLTEQALGALLLQLPAQSEHLDLNDLPRWFADYSARIVGPVLELYTTPLLADSTLLDAYLTAQNATPESDGTP